MSLKCQFNSAAIFQLSEAGHLHGIKSFCILPPTVIQKDCGVALYNIHGWFTTRDLDNDNLYDTYLDCLWIIIPRDNLTTILRVTEIDIEQSASCYFDYLKVRICRT